MSVAVRVRLASLLAVAAAGWGSAAAAQAPDGAEAHGDAPSDTAATLTLLQDRERLVPLAAGNRLLSLTIAPPQDASAGLAFDAALRDAGFAVESAHAAAAEEVVVGALDAAAQRADLVVVGAYTNELSPALVEYLRRTELTRPTLVLAFGEPRLLSALPGTGTYLLAVGPGDLAQRGAARGLAGIEPITGTLASDLLPHRAGEELMRDALPAPVRTAGNMPFAVNFVELDPEDAGMDAGALDRVDQIIKAALADSAAPGAAIAIGRHGKLVRLRGYGTIDYGDDRPVTPATIFDLASLTKVVATTTAAMILEAEGKLDLDAPVTRYLPWWSRGDRRKERITVRQLFLHRAGFAPFRPWYRDRRGREAYRDAIADERLQSNPGARTAYSDTDFMALGFVIEAAAGMPLDRFLNERVLGPLGMEDSGFRPPVAAFPRVAPTEMDTVFRMAHVRGVVHDENAYAMGGVAGHAGLFSTVWDLSVFADLMLGGGALPPCFPKVGSGFACTRPRAESVRLFPEESVARWTRRHDASSSRAHGWDTPEVANSSAGAFFTDRAFGHTGFTGTSIWIDPELDLYVVLLTNRINPTRENNWHIALRRAVADAVARAVKDRDVERRR